MVLNTDSRPLTNTTQAAAHLLSLRHDSGATVLARRRRKKRLKSRLSGGRRRKKKEAGKNSGRLPVALMYEMATAERSCSSTPLGLPPLALPYTNPIRASINMMAEDRHAADPLQVASLQGRRCCRSTAIISPLKNVQVIPLLRVPLR